MMGEYKRKEIRGKKNKREESADHAFDRPYRLETTKTPVELNYSRERQGGEQNAPVVQRVADIAEIALYQAYRKILQIYGSLSRTNLLNAMGNWGGLGFSRNIFPELPAFVAGAPGGTDCVNYFNACIRRYFTPGYPGQLNCPQFPGLTGAGLGSDQIHYGAGSDGLLGRDLDHRTDTGKLDPQLAVSQQGRPGSAVHVLSTILSAPFYTDIIKSFRDDGRMAHTTTFPIQRFYGGGRAKALAHGVETANKMARRPELQLPRLSFVRDDTIGSIGSYAFVPLSARNDVIRYNDLPDQIHHRVQYKQRTTRRTFVHEQFHHLEHYLGVEELANMYRFLYARTADWEYFDGPGGPALSRGVQRSGANFRLDLYRPALALPPDAGDRGDRQTVDKYTIGYMGEDSAYTRNTFGVAEVHPNMHNTEFLSTTAEMLSSDGLAPRLIQADPLRVALFLKLVNPPLYGMVAKQFDAQYNIPPPAPPGGAAISAPLRVTLDELLHFT